jgi:hypothetical protein
MSLNIGICIKTDIIFLIPIFIIITSYNGKWNTTSINIEKNILVIDLKLRNKITVTRFQDMEMCCSISIKINCSISEIPLKIKIKVVEI